VTAAGADVVINGREFRRRSYEGPADLRAMQSLTQRLWAAGPSRWHIGELVWFRLRDGGEPDGGARIALWESDGQLMAWAWARVSAAGTGLDLHLDPAHPELVAELLRWFEAEAEASEAAGEWSVTVLDTETALIESLRGLGYRERTDGGPFFVHLERGLRDLPMPQTPEGYWLRHVAGEADAEVRAAGHRAAFSRPGSPSRVTAGSYRQVMRCWPYRPDLDWLAGRTADGSPAAFSLVWLDEANRAAALEPVGTAPGHRRRGLARAATLAALHRARLLGAETARVCARGDDASPQARATYEGLGFRPFARNVTFIRDGTPTRPPA
jgi:ribosomal protein S18 acetylase RimI-like enzyme